MKNLRRFIICLLIIANCSCVSFAETVKVNYLIPEGFTGGVIIAFNQSDGITPKKDKDGTIIYYVPKDGLIKVKEPLEKAVYEFAYYFVNEKGDKMPIEYLYPGHYVRNPGDTVSKSFDTISEDETNNKTFAMIHTTVNFGVSADKIYFHNFIIGKPKDYQLLYLQTSEKIDEFQIKLSKAKKAEE